MIIKKLVTKTRFKGYLHHASKDDPQYMIKSDKRIISPFTRARRFTSFDHKERLEAGKERDDEQVDKGFSFTIYIADHSSEPAFPG